MLIVCPECSLQVSDKAFSCPHCGYPLKKQNIMRPSKARKRLPNGFGQISEIKSGNLRNRFRVMVPAGKTEEGRPISKLLKPKAYFKTYNDAYAVGLRLFWRDYGGGSKHRPHDGRVEFITLCKKYNVDEYAIKYIVGHQIKDLTERVYTKREIDWLRNEILKIPSGEFLGLKK